MLIGLVGKAMAGKSIAASYLEHVHGFHGAAFADPMRAGLKALLLMQDRDFDPERMGIPIEWIGQSPRQLLQSLGTEWGRNLVHRHILRQGCRGIRTLRGYRLARLQEHRIPRYAGDRCRGNDRQQWILMEDK